MKVWIYLFCTVANSNPNPDRGQRIGLVPSELRANQSAAILESIPVGEPDWTQQSRASPTDVQAVLMLPGEPGHQTSAGPTAQLSSALQCHLIVPPYRSWTQWSMWIPFPLRISCVSVIHPPKHHQSLTYFCPQQNIFYSYFSCSLPWFSAWLSMSCFCMYLQGLYSFYWHFLVNMGLGCNPPITHSKGVWLTSLSKSIEKSTARCSFIFFSRDLLGLSPVLCQCSGLPAPHGHLGEL